MDFKHSLAPVVCAASVLNLDSEAKTKKEKQI